MQLGLLHLQPLRDSRDGGAWTRTSFSIQGAYKMIKHIQIEEALAIHHACQFMMDLCLATPWTKASGMSLPEKNVPEGLGRVHSMH